MERRGSHPRIGSRQEQSMAAACRTPPPGAPALVDSSSSSVRHARTGPLFSFLLQQTPRCSLVGPPFVRRDDTSTGQTVLHSSSPSRSAIALAVSLPRVRFGTRPAEASARTIYRRRCNACARASPRTQGIRLTGVASRAVASLLAAHHCQIGAPTPDAGKPPQEIHHACPARGDDPGRPDADGSACRPSSRYLTLFWRIRTGQRLGSGRDRRAPACRPGGARENAGRIVFFSFLFQFGDRSLGQTEPPVPTE